MKQGFKKGMLLRKTKHFHTKRKQMIIQVFKLKSVSFYYDKNKISNEDIIDLYEPSKYLNVRKNS